MSNELRYNGNYNIEYDANGKRMNYEERLSKMKSNKPNYKTIITEENRRSN